MTRADRYAEFEWTPQATSLLADRFERQPVIGQRFNTDDSNGMLREWRIVGLFKALGQSRITARALDTWGHPDVIRVFERIGMNQWRAFQDPAAPVFSL